MFKRLHTKTGCMVTVFKNQPTTTTGGIYLHLAVDTRQAELKMTVEEARTLSLFLSQKADELESMENV